jgi:DNA-binding XRE family transcriptional regulator
MGKKIGLIRQSISSIERGNVVLTRNTFLSIFMIIKLNDELLYQGICTSLGFEEWINYLKNK